jgi:hypothetical protein
MNADAQLVALCSTGFTKDLRVDRQIGLMGRTQGLRKIAPWRVPI